MLRNVRDKLLNEGADCSRGISDSFWDSPDPKVVPSGSIFKIIYFSKCGLELVLNVLYPICILVSPGNSSNPLWNPDYRSSISENWKNMAAVSKGRSGCCAGNASLLHGELGPASMGDNRRSSMVCPMRDSVDAGEAGICMWVLTCAPQSELRGEGSM